MLIVDPRSHIFHYPNQLYCIETRSERRKLPGRHYPYWWSTAYGRQIGYMKGKSKSTWRARIRLLNRTYKNLALGEADDTKPADGLRVLSFEQALETAEEWFTDFASNAIDPVPPKHREPLIPDPPDVAEYTVGHAMIEYLHWYRGNRKDIRVAAASIISFVLPDLGEIPLSELTTSHIVVWLDKLTMSAARIRSGRGKPIRHKPLPRTRDELRRRKHSANRILAFLRAGLNKAFYDGHIDTDFAWRRVRKHRGVMQPRVRFLTRDECRQLIDAADLDIGHLVKGALLTGCRAGELQRMKVRDYLPQSRKVFIERTKSGYPRAVTLTDEGNEFFGTLASDRDNEAPLFVRHDGRPWGRDQYDKLLKEACQKAEIVPPISLHTLRHTYASHAAMAGIPLIVIAKQLGHANTRMVEKYYAHLAESFIDLQIRSMMPSIVT